MNERENRTSVIKRASWIGIIGNALLAIMKLFVGFFTGSLAVVGDGIDSASDIITSIISLVAARIMNKPPDKDHPYGHGRVETLSSKVISFIIFFAGIQLGSQAIQKLISGESNTISILAVGVSFISIIGKLFLSVYKFAAAKKINSQLLRADAKNMRNDIVISSAILIGLGAGKLTGLNWLDSASALFVSIWIIYVAFTIFQESNVELMEGHSDLKDYKNLFEAVKKVEGSHNPHKVRIRRVGMMLLIDIDIEVEGSLSVQEGHHIAAAVEKAAKEAIGNVYDVQVHVEPLGNQEADEKYGVTIDEL